VGKLVEYRNEADKDYHLIVTDDTSNSSRRQEDQADRDQLRCGNPDPRCVPGKGISILAATSKQGYARCAKRSMRARYGNRTKEGFGWHFLYA
jgi:hypothetical protein